MVVYLNFEPEDEGRVRAGFPDDVYARLVAVKDKWDPGNLFRINQNVPPSRQSTGWRRSTDTSATHRRRTGGE